MYMIEQIKLTDGITLTRVGKRWYFNGVGEDGHTTSEITLAEKERMCAFYNKNKETL